MSTEVVLPYTLAEYVPELRECDDEFRLRMLLHGFGLVCQHSDRTELARLLADEPDRIDDRWDAFLAALAAWWCEESGVEPPKWTQSPTRRLDRPWFVGGCFPSQTDWTIRTTPAVFKSRNVLLPALELIVV